MAQPGREMDEGLHVIAYSTGRYMDINDISRIRSHAMRTVQHRKYLERKNVCVASGHTTLRSAQPSRLTDRRCEPGDASQETLHDKLKVKDKDDERHTGDRSPKGKVVRQAKRLGLGPGFASQRLDPFDTFAQTIELEVMELFHCCRLRGTGRKI